MQWSWQLLCVMQVWFWREETMLTRYFGDFEIANATDEERNLEF
jgi:hypothetical protein